MAFRDVVTNRETKEYKKKILQAAMKDTIIPCVVGGAFVAIAELVLFVMKISSGYSFTKPYQARYLIAYIVLFILSIIAVIIAVRSRKNIEKNYKKVRAIQTFYAIAITAWSLCITFFDADHHDNFSYIIYVTIVVVLPLIVYINRYVSFCINFIGDALILGYMIYNIDRIGTGEIINFTVFALVSILATIMFGMVRFVSFKRQVQLTEMAEIDPLSRLYNRQKLHIDGNEALDKCKQSMTSIGVIMMDIDNFKKVNDTYGHVVGDEVIKKVASILKKQMEKYNGKAFRYGGEEFLLLVPGAAVDVTKHMLDEIMMELSEYKPFGDDKYVTISIGAYIDTPKYDETLEHVCKYADELLYISKTTGKNKYTFNEGE